MVAGSALLHIKDRAAPDLSRLAQSAWVLGPQAVSASPAGSEALAARGADHTRAPQAAATAQPRSGRQPRAPRVCAAPGCGATSGLQRCGGCGTVRYCGEACCKAHWREHRADCRRICAERAAAAASEASGGVAAA